MPGQAAAGAWGPTSARLVEVHVDALQLQVGIALVGAAEGDAMLVGDDLPELRAGPMGSAGGPREGLGL